MPTCTCKMVYGDGHTVPCNQTLESGEDTCYLHLKYLTGITTPCDEKSASDQVVAIIHPSKTIEFTKGVLEKLRTKLR